MIEVTNLQYRYRLREGEDLLALRGISLGIHPGESVAIVGTNGSGKSTLALCLNGLLSPAPGQVRVDGLDVARKETLAEVRRRVGMVFQNPDNQIISTTVEREIAFGLENLAIPAEQLRIRVEEVLEQFRLVPFRHRPPHLLSGGEKQRLSIAAVLALRPRYLILDEPTSLLDPISRREVRALIRELHEHLEVAVVHITQFPEEAAEAQRVLVLHAGELILEGTPQEVFCRRKQLYSLGLRPPFAMELTDRLRQRGLHLDASIDDLEGLVADLATIPAKKARMQLTAGEIIDQRREAVRPRVLGRERIRTENLWYHYHPGLPTERVALRDVNLSICQGELVGLVGPIGSGKSTLVQHLNGLLKPSRGRVVVDGLVVGENSRQLPQLRRKVGLVFQFPEKQLFEETVFDDVAFGPRNLDLAEDEISRRVQETLDLVGLDPAQFGQRSPFDLSGGEQRRVAIAGVLAMRPEILILDEPFVGLDPRGCQTILELIGQFGRRGTTVILITHHMDLVAPLIHRLVVLVDGQKAADDIPENIFGDMDRAASLGIDLPQAAQLILRLRELGWPIEGTALSMDQAVERIVKCIENRDWRLEIRD